MVEVISVPWPSSRIYNCKKIHTYIKTYTRLYIASLHMSTICIISKITYWPAFIQVNRFVQSFVLNTVNLFISQVYI